MNGRRHELLRFGSEDLSFGSFQGFPQGLKIRVNDRTRLRGVGFELASPDPAVAGALVIEIDAVNAAMTPRAEDASQ